MKVLAEPILLEGDLVRGFNLGRELRRDDRDDINGSSVEDEGGSCKGGGFVNLEDAEAPRLRSSRTGERILCLSSTLYSILKKEKLSFLLKGNSGRRSVS